MTFEVQPIGHVRNERADAVDDQWDLVNSTIQLD